MYEYILQDLTVSIQEGELFSNHIEDRKDLIEGKDIEEDIHEEIHQVHEIEQETPHESIEEEDVDEAHHVEKKVHEEGPIEITPPHKYKTLIVSPPFDEDEVTQSSFPPPHEYENMVSCTPFQIFDSYGASFHYWESEEVL
jgi:hypothetical protein